MCTQRGSQRTPKWDSHPATIAELPHTLKRRTRWWGARAGREERGRLAAGGQVRTGASSHGSEPATPPCGSTRGSARGTAAEMHATEVRESRGRLREEGQGYPTLFNDPFFQQENTKDRISGPKMLLAQKSES